MDLSDAVSICDSYLTSNNRLASYSPLQPMDDKEQQALNLLLRAGAIIRDLRQLFHETD